MLEIIGAIRTGSVGMEEKRGVNPRYYCKNEVVLIHQNVAGYVAKW